MNEKEFEKLREKGWRSQLTAEEDAALRAYLATNAVARIQWKEDLGLNECLGELPEVPVASNFTSRVLQAVAREDLRDANRVSGLFDWIKLRWAPIAAATVLVCAAAFSVVQYRAVQRTEMAQDFVFVTTAATVPQEWLEDFEAINRLSQPPVDEELLAALQ